MRLALTLFFLLPGPALAEGLFAAIAFSPATGMSGTAWNFQTQALAETEAYNTCGSKDCDTVVVFQQCGAIAFGVAVVDIVAPARTGREAQPQAQGLAIAADRHRARRCLAELFRLHHELRDHGGVLQRRLLIVRSPVLQIDSLTPTPDTPCAPRSR